MEQKKPEADYFSERFEKEIQWHSAKARDDKSKFTLLQTLMIVFSASIAIVNAVAASVGQLAVGAVIASLLGGVVVILTALVQLHKYQENWILYRTTSELLKKEKYFYLHGIGAYANLSPEQKLKALVERVEIMISSETSKYFVYQKPDKTEAQ